MQTLTLEEMRAIDRAKEDLVPRAENLIDSTRIFKAGDDFGNRQLRSLIAIANETESPAFVANFIRYQMGKDGKQKGWRYESDERSQSFGKRLLEEIENGAIGAVMEKHKDNLGLENEEKKQLVRIHLIRHFLGFASRYFKYAGLKEKEEGN